MLIFLNQKRKLIFKPRSMKLKKLEREKQELKIEVNANLTELGFKV